MKYDLNLPIFIFDDLILLKNELHQNNTIVAYKKIILGKNGIMIKKIREYSQKELSKVFNKKIHLYLEVVLEK